MGLFDIFKKTPTVRCVQCGVQIKETEAHRYRDGVYCSICFSHQDFSGGTKSSVTIDIPNFKHQQNSVKRDSDSNTMPASIRDIKKEFETANIKCLSAQFGDQWEVHAGVNGKGITYTMKFISKTTDVNNLSLRVFDLVHVPAERRTDVLRLLGRFQSRYRFWRFNLNSVNKLNVEYDFPPASSNHGKMAVEMFLRTMKLIDDIYPELSQCIWS